MQASAEGVVVSTTEETADLGPLGVLKRATDIVLAVVIIVVCSPILCAVALLIAAENGLPVLYRQERLGRNGRVFVIRKFRTMVSAQADEYTTGPALDSRLLQTLVREPKPQADPRVTRLGRWLRTWSLDELPQLWNVLRGDMSLVGPRPLRQFEVDSLQPWQRDLRHRVRPGMTGTWQVSGRSSIGWEDRIALDCEYARRTSPVLDLKVLLGTIPAVLRRDGAR